MSKQTPPYLDSQECLSNTKMAIKYSQLAMDVANELSPHSYTTSQTKESSIYQIWLLEQMDKGRPNKSTAG